MVEVSMSLSAGAAGWLMVSPFRLLVADDD
jgi:hypothetical protein